MPFYALTYWKEMMNVLEKQAMWRKADGGDMERY